MAFLLSLPIHLYRVVISPALHALATLTMGSGCGCRFYPSCSAYTLEALKERRTSPRRHYDCNSVVDAHDSFWPERLPRPTH